MNLAHYAFKVRDLESTRSFYIEGLGCREGRSTETWLDFEFFGHQLSAHRSDHRPELDYCGHVDGVDVPIPHFGCLLTIEQFESLHERLVRFGARFLVQPQIRYAGQPGEQRTMFVLDPSDNPLEFKAFANADEVFT